jgi:hypothetical protein
MKLTYLIVCPIYNNIMYFVAIMETSTGTLTITQIPTTISLIVYMRIEQSEETYMKNSIS